MATVEGSGSQDLWQVPDLWLRPDEIVYQQLLTQLEAAASHGNGFELNAIEVSVLVRRRKHFPDTLQQGQAVVDLPAPSPNEAPPTLAELLPHLQQIEALGGDYPHVFAHPRHGKRLRAEGLFDHIAPIVDIDTLTLETLVVVRHSPVSMHKTEVFESGPKHVEWAAGVDHLPQTRMGPV